MQLVVRIPEGRVSKRILGAILVLVLAGTARAEQIPLLADPDFERGFQVIAPHHPTTVEGNLQWDTSAGPPAWQLAQWASQSTIVGVTPTQLPSGAWRYANDDKEIIAGGGPTADESDLVLTINGVNEYGGTFRGPADPWPHLLVQQHIGSQPSIADMASLDFQIDARLLYDHRTTTDGYDPSLHASQYNIFYTVQNLNTSSPGYGDYLWFGTALYDDREEVTGKHVMVDEFTQSLIYSIGIEPFTSEHIADGNWMTVGGDLLPHMKAALDTAWSEGILLDSQDYADYHIGGMNMGWEMPGLNDASMQIRNYSVVATVAVEPPVPPRRFRDDATTVGLWHMDQLDNPGAEEYVPDDNSTGRVAHNLVLGLPGGDLTTHPTFLATGGPDGSGALEFDGVDDVAMAPGTWDDMADRVTIDFLMRPDSLPGPDSNNYMGLVGIGPAQTYLRDDGTGNDTGRLRALVFYDYDLPPVEITDATGGLALGEWHDVRLDVTSSGEVSLTVDGLTTTASMPQPMVTDWDDGFWTTNGAVLGRMWYDDMRFFDGALDEVRIATEPYVGGPGDFDGDGDVDGNDFLVWQRGDSPNGTTSGDLAEWQNHFGEGVGAMAAVSAVPEPTAYSLAALCIFLAFHVGRGRSLRGWNLYPSTTA